MDPDLIFKTLEEQSKRLSVFGDRYAKDELQILSKLKYAMPSDYDHVFTYLNTNEERQKSYSEQLETAKVMICSHYKTKIATSSKSENSMIYMIGNYGNRSQNSTPNNNVVCDFCKKPGHPMLKNGKPFCFRYKKKLKQESKKQEKKDEDKDINSLFVNCVYSQNGQKTYQDKQRMWLADTGAQCHIIATDKESVRKNDSSVSMGNASKSSVLRRENVIITDDIGNKVMLQDAHVVNGMSTNIISILQLLEEGWKPKIFMKDSKKIIQMTKDNHQIVFNEHKHRKNLCFLTAMIIENKLITAVENVQEVSSSKRASLPGPLKDWYFNDFHNKFGHHGVEQ